MSDEKTFTQADLDAAIEKAVGPLRDSIGNLETKRDELIADLRKARKAGEIKPETLEAVEVERDKAVNELAEAQKQVKALTKERDDAAKKLESETGFTAKLLVQDGIKSALIANGVTDEDFIDSLAAKFSAGASVKVEGAERKAMLGDKSLDDAIKDWAATDSAKKFIAAPNNSGGGAPGGGKGGDAGAKTINREKYEAMGNDERIAFFKDGGKLEAA